LISLLRSLPISPVLFVLLFGAAGHAAPVPIPFAQWTGSGLTLNNGIVQRKIKLPSSSGGPFLTTSYAPLAGEYKFFQPLNTDFQFEAGGVTYSGRSQWQLLQVRRYSALHSGDGAEVTLRSQDGVLEVAVRFLLYPGLPVIRKSIAVKNLGATEFALESVDVEKFNAAPYAPATFSWIFSDYGRRRSIGPYEGNMQDALVMLHNPDWDAGIILGNEASGVMKRTSLFWDAPEICVGLTHNTSRFPFRKWLQPGESFETPQVFTIVYNRRKDPNEILNTAVPDFVRRHMGTRLSELQQKPTFVYNTWHPFKTEINEQLVRELAKAAAAAGMKEFVIDDGWQSDHGDLEVDKTKFPRGLKPVFDYIRALGMKPGLWLSVGSASSTSKVFEQHPEWFVRDQAGNFANLQLDGQVQDIRSACFSTGWKNYIRGILMKLALEHGLEYLKLDFAVVTSAYRFNKVDSGCYARNHPGHKDHHESLFVNYQRVWDLFDELHASKSNLFIDCTFEAMGGLQLIDYAMLKHAEGNWLANFYSPNESGDLRTRNMAWWRSPAIPATALVIGNPKMDDAGWEGHIQSLAGALPIMLGDPRKLPPADLKRYRGYADWLQSMQARYDFMNFRQDLAGFGEPSQGSWDGFQRINTETRAGGIVGIFRGGAPESSRTIVVRYLDPVATYEVRFMDGRVCFRGTGSSLASPGFPVSLSTLYGGVLFEIARR
jgi:alpha-galactosidase